ncbi:DUF6682 family protein [Caballeronia zhejiangensis]|uniref:Uncharacterized protein n=1 Tax=Caballeronia zhejiangensis TaxID=871203 RepID=A0A656QAW9_9BURK|nr:DUF6682 family protein [Caballeronia zhejiangensis]KDR25960.1 hypothetical protein BG60_26465 [Caballeronia zhejiangensis]
MAITVQDVIDRTSDVLNDVDLLRWKLEERLRWIHDALREIATRKPSAMEQTSVWTLVAGTRQTVPDDSLRLIDMPRNIAADGVTPGYAITPTSRAELDTQIPDWHMARVSTRIRHVTYDYDADPLHFYVYPPAADGVKVEAINCANPPELTALTDVLPIRDKYVSAITSFVLYRALSRESEDASGQLAAAHYSAFAGALGDAQQAAQAAQTAGV